MSARSLDEGVVLNKLDAIERAVKTLQSIAPLDAERLNSDAVTAAWIRSPSVLSVSDLDDRTKWHWRTRWEAAVACRAEVLDQVHQR